MNVRMGGSVNNRPVGLGLDLRTVALPNNGDGARTIVPGLDLDQRDCGHGNVSLHLPFDDGVSVTGKNAVAAAAVVVENGRQPRPAFEDIAGGAGDGLAENTLSAAAGVCPG